MVSYMAGTTGSGLCVPSLIAKSSNAVLVTAIGTNISISQQHDGEYPQLEFRSSAQWCIHLYGAANYYKLIVLAFANKSSDT